MNKKSIYPWLILAIIIIASGAMMLKAAWSDSAIMDELAHTPAGYGYVSQLDYRLNPEHPPLVKALGALPVKLFINPVYPTTSSAWTSEVNGQWDMGTQFLYNSGNNADQILHVFRLFPIFLTLLLVLLIYIWAKEIVGGWWALLPAFLFAVSPNVLAHGHYVTTDVAAAFGIVLGTYYFLKFLFKPSKLNLFLAGIAFGIAQLTKFSAVMLIPYFIFLIIVFYALSVKRDWLQTDEDARLRRFSVRGWRYLRAVIIIFVIGYVLIVWPVYALFTIHYPIQKQISDTSSILASFAGGPTPAGHICNPMRCIANLDVWMTKSPILRPLAQYALGVLMVFQRVNGGNTVYFLGQVSNSGWWYYFPTIYLLKETLPALILILAALAFGIWKAVKAKPKWQKLLNYIYSHFAQFSMISFVVFYWAYSMHSDLNIGFRHLFPTLPLIYILTASAIKSWFTHTDTGNTQNISLNISSFTKEMTRKLIKYLILFVILVWALFEAFAAYPYFLSYFNEIGGGVWNGYKIVGDSNYDWGQDMIRLKNFVDSHPEINKIAVDYFGGGDPSYYLGNKEVNWWASRGDPANSGIHYLAISINTLEQALITAKSQPQDSTDNYTWLVKLRPPKPGLGEVPAPDYRAGTSIFIYKL
ncbi:MAG: glycosyltransferase family 39 protein [Patescibacteria group bacterium]|nr:glycosyltransferase family 39 protein [Patescibacteria group bacterium]